MTDTPPLTEIFAGGPLANGAPGITADTLRAMLDAATPGPWQTHNIPGDWGLPGAVHIIAENRDPYNAVATVDYVTPYCAGSARRDREAAATAQTDARLIALAPTLAARVIEQEAEIERLTAERDEALANVAAAYEAAAQEVDDGIYMGSDGCGNISIRPMTGAYLRARTPAMAKYALSHMLRHAEAKGMRDAAALCEPHRDDDGMDRQAKRECATAILARAEEISRGKP